MSTETATKAPGGFRVAIQKVGSFMSGMVMPNIPALVAWGLFTAFFIKDGWTPNADLETIVGPMIHYLLPLIIAYTGGFMIYDKRGGVVGVIATMGAISGSDLLIAAANADGEGGLGQIHMFLGAMIMGPLAAWIMKKLDALWEGKIKAGFEMLVNMFSAGILGFQANARIDDPSGDPDAAWVVDEVTTEWGNVFVTFGLSRTPLVRKHDSRAAV